LAQNRGPAPGAANRPAASGGRGGGFFTGLFVGILLGIGMALAVAVWLNVRGSPFSEREAPAELPPIKRPADLPRPASGEALVPGAADDGSTDGGSRDDRSAPAGDPRALGADARDPGSGRTLPADRPSQPRTGLPEALYLQAGAFRNALEADDRKVSISLLGETAAVQRVAGSGGPLYRIRVGPFASQAELERARDLLKDNGIDSIPVRPGATTP